uniref:AB hydrolase-1 domain-containing protein n=1 Tax=Aegilops tauschii subsp. strangulata TaxID=200361 RepID=A0A453G0Z9_AEGTS
SPRSTTRSRPSSPCRSSRTGSWSSTSSATSSAASAAAASSSPSTPPPRSTTASPPSAAPSTAGTWRRLGLRARICRHCSWESTGDRRPSPTRGNYTQFVMVEPLLWIGCWPLIWRVWGSHIVELYISNMVVSDIFSLADADEIISKDSSTPLLVVVPGLTSDSDAAYAKHLVHSMARKGWNVVVSNHRGLGGVSITSDCLYNGGWTEDVREVINYLHRKYPKAPMFCVGTSIGANILVKYLGEEGESTPLAGAASICSPWDLVVCDRFISRKLVQRFYDKALAFGLKGYAKLHQPVLARLANWEGIKKSRSIREFDHHATCIVAKYETVDTYYRRCSSASFVGNVSVPLLCISALDDPLCTREAIPWDECRANKNIVLATTQNGGHLAFFQGLTAGKLWWVGAVSEFLCALHDSSYMHQQKAEEHVLHSSLESSIDKSPYVNILGDGMIAPVGNDGPPSSQISDDLKPNATVNST